MTWLVRILGLPPLLVGGIWIYRFGFAGFRPRLAFIGVTLGIVVFVVGLLLVTCPYGFRWAARQLHRKQEKNDAKAEQNASANAGSPSRLQSDAIGPAWLRFTFGDNINMHTQLLAVAKEHFAFLADLGFIVSSEKEGRYTTFHDTFFKVRYTSSMVEVEVAYYDLQLDVTFIHGSVTSTYLFIDKQMFSNASGFAGNMFSDVPSAIAHIAADVRAHYGALLNGDPEVWHTVERLASAPKPKGPYLP